MIPGSGQDPIRDRAPVITALGAQFGHQGVPVSSPPQRQRRQVQSGWPALHPLEESIHLLWHEAETQAPVQECVRFLGREPQIVGAQLEQVAVGAQRGQRKVRLGPG
jgi:hypothetical protein